MKPEKLIGDEGIERARDLKSRLERKLLTEKAHDLVKVLEECDQEIWLRCSECQARKRGFTRCKKRWCPICARAIAAERVFKHERALKTIKWPLHITFTIQNTHELTTSNLRSLLRAFRRLRQRRLWKLCVRGGWVSLEITNRGNGWHPHLHVLADVEWLSLTCSPPRRNDSRERKKWKCDQAAKELSDTWAELVGQKTASVKSRRCAGAVAIREVMKYAVKGTDLVESKASASAVIRAMKSTRLFRGFGTCYGRAKELEPLKAPCTCDSCQEVCSYIPEDVLATMHERNFRSRRAPSKFERAA